MTRAAQKENLLINRMSEGGRERDEKKKVLKLQQCKRGGVHGLIGLAWTRGRRRWLLSIQQTPSGALCLQRLRVAPVILPLSRRPRDQIFGPAELCHPADADAVPTTTGRFAGVYSSDQASIYRLCFSVPYFPRTLKMCLSDPVKQTMSFFSLCEVKFFHFIKSNFSSGNLILPDKQWFYHTRAKITAILRMRDTRHRGVFYLSKSYNFFSCQQKISF